MRWQRNLRPSAGIILAAVVLCVSSVAPGLAASAKESAETSERGPNEPGLKDQGRQWVSGRVAVASSRSTPSSAPDGKQRRNFSDALQSLGLDPPPAGVKVELVEVASDYHRRLSILDKRDFRRDRQRELGAEQRRLIPVAADGRFEFRTERAGRWKVVVSAPRHVSMQAFLPGLPVEFQLGTVWLPPAEAVAVPAERKVGPVWVSSVYSQSSLLDLQRQLGPWRRVPVREWARHRDGARAPPLLTVARGVDETLGLLWDSDDDRGAVFLLPNGDARERLEEVEEIVVEAKGPLVAGGLKLVGSAAAPNDFGLELENAVITVDGKVVGVTSDVGELRTPLHAGATIEVLTSNAGWSRQSVRTEPIEARDLLEVRLNQPRPVQLVVRDQRSNRVVSGAFPARSGAIAEASTDDGRLTLAFTPDLVSRFGASGNLFASRIAAVGYLPTTVTWDADRAPPGTVTDVHLLRHAVAEGRVVSRDGRPVAGVDLVAIPTKLGRSQQETRLQEDTRDGPETDRDASHSEDDVRAVWGRSDEAGLFRLQQLHPGLRYGLFALSRDYPLRPMTFEAPDPGERRQDLVVRLFRPLDAVGWVLDSAGQAVAGATVRMRGYSNSRTGVLVVVGTSPRLSVFETSTNEEGFFSFDDIETGSYGIEVDAPGLASSFVPTHSITLDSARPADGRLQFEVGTFYLADEVQVPVRVIDEDGASVVPATVYWSFSSVPSGSPIRFATRAPNRSTSTAPSWWSAAVDEWGEALLTGIESESMVSVRVEAQGFVTRKINQLVVDWENFEGGGSEPVLIPLRRAASVEGFVTDSSGRRLANAHVSLHSLDSDPEFPDDAYARTGDDGEFAFDGLPAGGLRVLVNAVDAPVVDPLELVLEAGELREGVELRAPPGASVRGTVYRAGTPAADVTVVCDGKATTTDASGTFEVRHVRQGRRAIEARGRNTVHKSVEVTPSGASIDFDLEEEDPETQLERGRFSVSGVALTDDTSGLDISLLWRSGARTGVVYGGNGRFFQGGLPPGRYRLLAMDGDGRKTLEFEIVDQDVLDLVIDLRGKGYGSLGLTVEGLDEKSLESAVRFGMNVTLRHLETGSDDVTFTSRRAQFDGAEFVLDRLSVGSFEIKAVVGGGVLKAETSADVLADQRSSATLVFQRTDLEQIQGLLLVNGQPSSGWLAARPPQRASSDEFGVVAYRETFAQVNPLGQFEINAVPGELQLLVSVGSWIGTFPAEAIPGEPLVLEVERVSMSGRAVRADGTPAEDVTIVANRLGVEPSYCGRTTTRQDGGFLLNALSAGEPIRLSVSNGDSEDPVWETVVSPRANSPVDRISVQLPP